jgi:peptidoglycan-N-acetylglucosamine deacetylase
LNEGERIDWSFQTDARAKPVRSVVVRRILVLAAVALLLPSAARTSPRKEDGARSKLEALARDGTPLYCGGRHGRYVALTFDDGPSSYTLRVLRLLARAHAPATFFVVGSRTAARPDLVRAESLRGVVGNHTWTHPRLASLDRRDVIQQLLRTQAAIVRATGGVRPVLFRPPYGIGTPAEAAAVRALGLVDVRWSVDSLDSRPGATPASVVRNVVAGLRPGAIVLLHEIHPWTVAALPRILHALRRRGFTPVTIPELVALDPPSHAELFPVRPSGRCG